MQGIRVAKNGVGECYITPHRSLKESSKYLIKALCFLIMIILNERNELIIDKLIKIIEEATTKTENLLNESGETSRNQEANPTELF